MSRCSVCGNVRLRLCVRLGFFVFPCFIFRITFRYLCSFPIWWVHSSIVVLVPKVSMPISFRPVIPLYLCVHPRFILGGPVWLIREGSGSSGPAPSTAYCADAYVGPPIGACASVAAPHPLACHEAVVSRNSSRPEQQTAGTAAGRNSRRPDFLPVGLSISNQSSPRTLTSFRHPGGIFYSIVTEHGVLTSGVRQSGAWCAKYITSARHLVVKVYYDGQKLGFQSILCFLEGQSRYVQTQVLLFPFYFVFVTFWNQKSTGSMEAAYRLLLFGTPCTPLVTRMYRPLVGTGP